MQEEHEANLRAWIHDVRIIFDDRVGEMPRKWPDAMVMLPYWQQGYSPSEFVETFFIIRKEEG